MAEKFIHINVDAKIPTLAYCVKLKAGQSYSATIVQGDDYDGNSGVNLVFNNFCSEAFTVPSIDWFTDTVDGGNFRAYTDSFIILPNQEKSMPLKFIGTYLSDVTSHAYTLTLNGVSNTFTLTITIPVENNPPIISNFSKLLENRAEYTFLLTDFTSKYSDIDGNPLDGVIISGDTSNFILQGLPLVSGTEITPTQISSGYLKYVSPNVNTQSQSTVTWYAKDSLGLISNPATITMTSKSYCVAPTLNNVAFVNNNTVLYDWNSNGVDYGVSGSIILEVSTDGGASYIAIGSVSPTSSPTTITSPIINSITNGSSVKFRITASGGACVSQSSNVITQTWVHFSDPPTAVISQDLEGININSIYNSSNNCYLYATNLQAYNGAVITSASWQIRNITTDSGWIDLETVIEGSGESFVTNNMDFGFRVKLVDSNGLEGYSNELSKYYTLEYYTFEVDFYNDGTSACSATSGNRLQEFTTITPIEGDVCYEHGNRPYTGSFSYIKIFNYGNVTGNNVVFAINGSTGVLGAINEC